jgi:hypothetical protein
MSYISTSHGLFLVSFNGNLQQFIFNTDNEALGNLIAEHGRHGIVFIKRFYPVSSSLKKMSKKEIESMFSYDTHTIEQLKKANFIK